MKACSKCKVPKSHENFSKCKLVKSGLRSTCKACDSLKFKAYSTANAEKLREKGRERYQKNASAGIARATDWRKNNPEKSRALKRAWYRANPDKCRNMQLRREFGITLKEFADLKAKQGGKCAICSISGDDVRRGLCVDHCHESGTIRGLLCARCNSGIGMLGDSRDILLKAAEYLGDKGG